MRFLCPYITAAMKPKIGRLIIFAQGIHGYFDRYSPSCYGIKNIVIHHIWGSVTLQPWLQPAWRVLWQKLASFISCPTSPCDTIVHIPVQHHLNLRSASSEPSRSIPKPPFMTSPQPTPPPL